MNNLPLDAVRELKLQQLSDDEIRQRLRAHSTDNEINQALLLFKDMQAPLPLTASPALPPPKPRKKIVILLLIVGAVIVTSLSAVSALSGPKLLQLFNTGETNRLIKALADDYAVKTFYRLGSATECTKQGPTSFGDVTGLKVCYNITAVVYYPKITIGNDSDPPAGSRPIYYNRSVSSQELKRQTKAQSPDSLTVSSIFYKSDTKQDGLIAGVYDWNRLLPRSNTGLSVEPSDVLLLAIDKKMEMDSKLSAEAPSPSEAIKDGRAPLIVVIRDRYCHSPSILGADYSCMLPN